MTEPSDSRDAAKGRAKRNRNSSRPADHMLDALPPEPCECRRPLIDYRVLEEDERPRCWWCGREVER